MAVRRTEAAGSVREQLEALSARGRKFGAVLADPPYRFINWTNTNRTVRTRGGRHHYRTMSTDWIANLPLFDVAARDCVLFLWVPWPHLRHGLELVDRWGFSYRTMGFDWMKVTASGNPAIGMGFWTRGNTEGCILATRGQPRRVSRSVRMAILEPRREHSRKPDCVHDRIQALVKGPHLELFGRREVPGWTVIGDQTRKFNDG